MIEIGPLDRLADREFTAVEAGQADLATMNRMLARLRRHLASLTDGTAGDAPFDPRSPRDDRLDDPSDGGSHRIVITDPARAAAPGDLIVVGFFGQARTDVDHGPIIDLEGALIADMAGDRNPLVYYNVHWRDAGWGNLVLFTDLAARQGWGHDPRHAEAVARSPRHYHSIRLHHGILVGGIPGSAGIELVRTRYFDFSGPTPWRAVRRLV